MSMSNVDKQYKYCDDQMYFVFKGICSSKYNLFMVNEGDGLVLYNGTSASIETTGAQYQNGNYLLGIKKESRPINFDVAASGLSKLQVEQLLKWLTVGEVGELSFYHSPEWGYDVVIEDVVDPVIYIDDDGYVFTSKLKFKTIGSYYAHNLYGKEWVMTSYSTSDNNSYKIEWPAQDSLQEGDNEYIQFSATVPQNHTDYIFEYRGKTNTVLYNNQLMESPTNGLANMQVIMSLTRLDHPLVRFDAPFAPFEYDGSAEQLQLIADALDSRMDVEIYQVQVSPPVEWNGRTLHKRQFDLIRCVKVGYKNNQPSELGVLKSIIRCEANIDPHGLPLIGQHGNDLLVFLTGNMPSYFSIEFTQQSQSSAASYEEELLQEQTAENGDISTVNQNTTATTWIIPVVRVKISAPANHSITFHHHAFNNIIMR